MAFSACTHILEPKHFDRKCYEFFAFLSGFTEYRLIASSLRMFGALVLIAIADIPHITESVWKS